MDNIVIDPDEGFDAIKQVIIDVNIQPPAEHNIEEVKNYEMVKLQKNQNIRPSEGYDYIQEVNLKIKIPIVSVDFGFYGRPIDGEGMYIPEQHWLSEMRFKSSHKWVAEKVLADHVRLICRIKRINPEGLVYAFTIYYSTQEEKIGYYSPFDYMYLDVNLSQYSELWWDSVLWKIKGIEDHEILAVSPSYGYPQGGLGKLRPHSSIIRFAFQRSKYLVTELENSISIMDETNQDNELVQEVFVETE